MASSLDKQSQSITQIINNDNDKHMTFDETQIKKQHDVAYNKGEDNS